MIDMARRTTPKKEEAESESAERSAELLDQLEKDVARKRLKAPGKRG